MKQTKAGFILLGPSWELLYANSEAIQILAYPEDPEKLTSPERFIASKIQSVLTDGRPSHPPVVAEFASGRRRYLCRAFSLDSPSRNSLLQPTVALVLERKSPGSLYAASLAGERFDLTPREQETLEFLVQGLTNKEIGDRMKISPNTVKAFLKFIMVKVGVSTRSGLVAVLLTSEEQQTASMPATRSKTRQLC